MKTRRWIKITFPFLLIFGLYFLGPKPDKARFNADLPVVPEAPVDLETFIANNENRYKIKPDNEARIIWKDSMRQKTGYSVVYLHGFSASQKEGDPVHRRFAKNFGCNLFLPRLADHGIDTTESLFSFTADRVWNSAKEALAIGKRLGDKVVLISTSTGGTLALMLAAKYPQDVYALINLSPNIAINDPAAFILNDPWGLHIARLVFGGKYVETEYSEERARYWNGRYRLESVVELEELLESSMTAETFRSISQPSLTLYYYKNENEQDPEVSVSAIQDMHRVLATPDSLKILKAMPNAGAHVLGSSLTSHDVEGVYNEIETFAQTKLRMPKSQSLAMNK
jgi:pimeloyl-ACP methyl ester carboxylesterase